MGDGMFRLLFILENQLHFSCQSQAVTIPLTFIGFAGGVMFFGSLEMDPTKPIFVRFKVLQLE